MVAQVATTWPLCHRCGEIELFSSVTPPDPAKIRGCYACGWKPGANDPGKLEGSPGATTVPAAHVVQSAAPRAPDASQGPPREDLETFPRSPRWREDAGAAGRAAPLCSARVKESEWWCVLEQGHAGEHQPPRDARPLPAPSSFERGRRRG